MKIDTDEIYSNIHGVLVAVLLVVGGGSIAAIFLRLAVLIWKAEACIP